MHKKWALFVCGMIVNVINAGKGDTSFDVSACVNNIQAAVTAGINRGDLSTKEQIADAFEQHIKAVKSHHRSNVRTALCAQYADALKPEQLKGHWGAIAHVSLSKDGNTLYSAGGGDGMVIKWEKNGDDWKKADQIDTGGYHVEYVEPIDDGLLVGQRRSTVHTDGTLGSWLYKKQGEKWRGGTCLQKCSRKITTRSHKGTTISVDGSHILISKNKPKIADIARRLALKNAVIHSLAGEVTTFSKE